MTPAATSPVKRRSARAHEAIAVATLLVAIAAGLWLNGRGAAFDVRRPISYAGDGLSYGFLVKTILDVGWYPIHTSFVGAPFGSDLFDYPFSDSLNFLTIALLGLGSSNWIVVSGLFFLLGYFLAGVAAYLVLRQLGVGAALSVAAAALFALLPFHFARRSLLLAAYAVVPLGVWLAHVVWERKPCWYAPRRARIWRALIIVAVGSSGAYYAFFSAFLIAVAGIARSLSARSWRAGLPAAGLVIALSAVVLANVATTIAYELRHGRNSEVAHRGMRDSEIYGLKLTQLLLPSPDHRIEALRDLTNRYKREAPLVNENANATLGFVGSAGLLLLFACALRRLAGGALDSTTAFLATMAVAAFMLGTVGGIGALFSLLVSPLIRGYNRISFVIAFVSLAAIAMAIQRIAQASGEQGHQARAIVCAAALLAIGAFDQIPERRLGVNEAMVASDRAFVRQLETKLAPGSAVLQLPYEPFPESAGVQRMENYGPLRGYLFSRTLRWSYGTMRGRDGDLWLRALLEHPIAEQLDLASSSGFGAVYVDRRGYADSAAALEQQLRQKLGAPIAESADHQLVAYRMIATGSSPLPLERLLPPIDTPIHFDQPELSSLVRRTAGISGWETWGRWTDGGVAQIVLARNLPSDFTLRIETAMAFPPSAGAELSIRIGDERRSFEVGSGSTRRDVSFHLQKQFDAIEILIPNPRSPAHFGMSADTRQLGIGLKSITVLLD
jgi:phosphoglycerol transferase